MRFDPTTIYFTTRLISAFAVALTTVALGIDNGATFGLLILAIAGSLAAVHDILVSRFFHQNSLIFGCHPSLELCVHFAALGFMVIGLGSQFEVISNLARLLFLATVGSLSYAMTRNFHVQSFVRSLPNG